MNRITVPGISSSRLRAHSAARERWLSYRADLEASGQAVSPLGPRQRRKVNLLDTGCRILTGALRICGILPHITRRSRRIKVEQLELWFEQLPSEFDGYRILHITDPHFDAAPGIGGAISRAVAGLTVDLCVFTGDFRADDRGPFRQTTVGRDLACLLSVLDAGDGVLAVLGNHDTWEMVDPFEHGLGMRILANETVTVRRNDTAIAIAGLDDVHNYWSPMTDECLSDLSRNGPPFRLALVHSPEYAAEAAAAGCALYLCGHTHGGQICLREGKPIVTQLVRNRAFATGLWRCGRMVGYTSHGAGLAAALPARINTPGEVTVFTLRSGQRPVDLPETQPYDQP
jgi:predicted MPP superfamily phosphohydrolase